MWLMRMINAARLACLRARIATAVHCTSARRIVCVGVGCMHMYSAFVLTTSVCAIYIALCVHAAAPALAQPTVPTPHVPACVHVQRQPRNHGLNSNSTCMASACTSGSASIIYELDQLFNGPFEYMMIPSSLSGKQVPRGHECRARSTQPVEMCHIYAQVSNTLSWKVSADRPIDRAGPMDKCRTVSTAEGNVRCSVSGSGRGSGRAGHDR